MREQKDLEWFIDTVLLGDLRRMVYDSNLHYLSFIPLACGIEFLGACRDSQPFYAPHMTRQRFGTALITLFPDEYTPLIDLGSKYNLYSNLYENMTLILKPGPWIDLSTIAESLREGTTHLGIRPDTEKMVILLEMLYSDFAEACRKLKTEMRAGLLTKKLSDPYLGIDI